MRSSATYRFLTTLIVGLFLFLQVSNAAHALHDEDSPHQQDCVVCHLVSESAADQLILPPNPVDTDFEDTDFVETYGFITLEAWSTTPPGRAPPPRGPPS